jgi:hypothetical protein
MQIPMMLVIIDRGPMEKIPRHVAEHEIPLLEMIHGGGSVRDSGEPIDAVREIDSPEAEYERLLNTYGDDEKSGMPLVERVHGRISEFCALLDARYGNHDGDAEGDPAPRKRRASA